MTCFQWPQVTSWNVTQERDSEEDDDIEVLLISVVGVGKCTFECNANYFVREIEKCNRAWFTASAGGGALASAQRPVLDARGKRLVV